MQSDHSHGAPSHGSTGLMEATSIPDHLDILAKMACGAQMNMTISAVATGEQYFEIQGSTGVIRCSITNDSLTMNGLQPSTIAVPPLGAVFSILVGHAVVLNKCCAQQEALPTRRRDGPD